MRQGKTGRLRRRKYDGVRGVVSEAYRSHNKEFKYYVTVFLGIRFP